MPNGLFSHPITSRCLRKKEPVSPWEGRLRRGIWCHLWAGGQGACAHSEGRSTSSLRLFLDEVAPRPEPWRRRPAVPDECQEQYADTARLSPPRSNASRGGQASACQGPGRCSWIAPSPLPRLTPRCGSLVFSAHGAGLAPPGTRPTQGPKDAAPVLVLKGSTWWFLNSLLLVYQSFIFKNPLIYLFICLLTYLLTHSLGQDT